MISANTKISSKTNFLEGTVLLFYKPIGWTSFDVVKKIRNLIKSSQNIRKIKVGHAGTLDPLAHGLLIICTGKLTKKISVIQSQKKTYTGEIIFGATTPSYDKETTVNKKFNTSHITESLIHSVCKKFEGEIMQKPPMFSALKKDGQRLYEHARKGQKIDVEKRLVSIDYFNISNIDMPLVKFKVTCSKGTYIRSLIYDYAKALKSGAYLGSLKREKIGDYLLSEAYTIESFTKLIKV